METSFYHDEVNQHDAVKKLKRNMTLDFIGSMGGPSTKKQKVSNNLNMLSSPDLNMLKLASPELERMIISANGLITTTPTPTQFLCPSNVTEEQEAYARGFVDALNQLHENKEPNEADFVENNSAIHSMPATLTSVTTPAVCSTSMPMPTMTSQAYTTTTSQAYTTTTSLPGSGMNMGTYNNTIVSLPQQQSATIVSSQQQPIMQNDRVIQLKEEPQIVPCLQNMPSPPMFPIDMGHQEVIKLDRKRERNRVAARKCRTRKLERISRLEDRVDQLKGHNTDLTQTASDLRDQVCKLKEQIMTHVNSGCHVMLSQNIL
jgi:transcription factor AP-1